MKLLARLLLAAALAVSVVGAAQAQRPMQPGQGGRQGGFGAVTISLVLTNKDLQEDLKITDDQKGKLKDVTAKTTDLAKKQAELFTGGGGRPDMAKMQEMQKERTELTAEVKKVTDEVLTSDQKKRFKQIEVQAKGIRAFTDADIVKELKITDDQKKALKEVADASTKEIADLAKEIGVPVPGGMRPMGGGAGGTPPDAEKMAEFTKKVAPLRASAIEKSVKALDAAQQKQWTEMIGTKFDVSKLTPARPMRMAN